MKLFLNLLLLSFLAFCCCSPIDGENKITLEAVDANGQGDARSVRVARQHRYGQGGFPLGGGGYTGGLGGGFPLGGGGYTGGLGNTGAVTFPLGGGGGYTGGLGGAGGGFPLGGGGYAGGLGYGR